MIPLRPLRKFVGVAVCIFLAGAGIERTIGAGKAASTATAAKAKPDAAKKSAKAKPPAKPSGKKANAKQLLADAKKALAFTVKSARADAGLDAKAAKNKPFWKATQRISKSLDRAEKGLAAKSDDFFAGISDARAVAEEMKITWQLTNSKNQQVIDGGKKLGHALSILRTDFSKEAARKKKGGELTAQEKQKFEKIKAQQKALLGKIATLEKKATKDKALRHGLEKMKRRAQRISRAPATVDAFIAALYAVDEIEGLLYGYDYYIDREYRGDWIDVSQTTTEWETTYAEFTTEETYEWSEVETSVDIDVNEEVDISEEMTTEEIAAEENYAETESFDMSDAEEEEVAVEENTDEEIDSDDSADADSMEDASDDDGDADGDTEESADSGDDGSAEDSGGDDGGE